MIRHARSFIVSIIIHLALIAVMLVVYKGVNRGLQSEKKEPLLCIKLSSCTQSKKPSSTPPKVKKVIKKKTVVKKKNVLKKKTVVLKKEELSLKKSEKKEIKEKKIKSQTKEVKKIQKKKVLTPPTPIITQKTAPPEKEYIDENIAKIVALLQENLYYPRRARKRGIQGEVLIHFSLSKQAKISNITVLSSKSDILSRAAVETIKNVDNKLPKPKDNISFNIPISYKLD